MHLVTLMAFGNSLVKHVHRKDEYYKNMYLMVFRIIEFYV